MKPKHLLSAFFLIVSVSVFAQAQQCINYQAVARDTNGMVLANSSLNIRISILADSINGTLVYCETHAIITNSLGLVKLEIGNGIPQTGTYAGINWGNSRHYVQTEIDFANSGNYLVMGCNELVNVPYALHSDESKQSRSLLLMSPDSSLFLIKVENDGSLTATEGAIPEVDFIADKTASYTGISIQFTDQSANSPGSWQWNFGDGSESQDQHPIQIYADTGTFTVSLTALNGYGGDTETKTAFISIGENMCPLSVTDIDGNEYNVIPISNQCWMKENLKVSHYPNGDDIPNVTDENQWTALGDNNTDDAYCYYDNDPNTDYGALYTYAAAIADNWQRDNTAGQGICPDGWHLPTDSEWNTLRTYLGGESIAGGKMKETGTLHWNDPNVGATNESGLTALPGGYRCYFQGNFSSKGDRGYIWSATGYRPETAYIRYLYNINTKDYRSTLNKSYGLSIRCIKND